VSSLAVLEQERSFNVDAVEEMRMRTWARRHYTPAEDRSNNLHPIVLDEMLRKDEEQAFRKSPK
jgi:hypothetical protein